jgi:hypothetical protein
MNAREEKQVQGEVAMNDTQQIHDRESCRHRSQCASYYVSAACIGCTSCSAVMHGACHDAISNDCRSFSAARGAETICRPYDRPTDQDAAMSTSSLLLPPCLGASFSISLHARRHTHMSLMRSTQSAVTQMASVVSEACAPLTQEGWLAAQIEQRRKWDVEAPARVAAAYRIKEEEEEKKKKKNVHKKPGKLVNGPGFVLLICDTLEEDKPATHVYDASFLHRFQVTWVRTHPGAYIGRACDMNPLARVLLAVAVPQCMRACGLVVEAFEVTNVDGWFRHETTCIAEITNHVRDLLLMSAPKVAAVVPVSNICQNRSTVDAAQKERVFDLDAGMSDSESENE